jgi:hypothetical protein
MNVLVKFQQAWQCQQKKNYVVNPDELLKTARLERRAIFLCELFVIAVLSFVGISMLGSIHDIRKDWPWLIYTGCMAWVVGFMLFNQWRTRRRAVPLDAPMLAHVEASIKELEHRIWQDRCTFWWYTMPIALGCIVPPTIFFFIEFSRQPRISELFSWMGTVAFFMVIFAFVHVIISKGHRKTENTRRRELEALRSLRETLLSE